MSHLEETVLRDSPYIGGEKLSVADIHAIWGVRWDLHSEESQPPGLGAGTEPAVSRDKFPKVWRLIDSLPASHGKTIPFEVAKNKIEASSYTSDVEGVQEGEPTGIKAGTQVTVDSLG
jgi:glutathione S-transferase